MVHLLPCLLIIPSIQIFYSPLSGPDPIGEIGDRELTFDLDNANDVSVDLTGLTPNSPYEVTICARTNPGCGVNMTVSQTTTEDSEFVRHKLQIM